MNLDEESYERGQQAVWLQILRLSLKELDDGKSEARLQIELVETRAAVRRLYEPVIGQKMNEAYYLPDVIATIEKRWPTE